MSDPLIRGAVVQQRARYGVVWGVGEGSLVLLPVMRPEPGLAYDVSLELADLVACGITIPDAVIRPRIGRPIDAEGWLQVGTVPGRTMCRVSHGLARVEAEAAHHDKWSAARRQRAHAGRGVNLAGPTGAAAPPRVRVVFRVRSEPPASGGENG